MRRWEVGSRGRGDNGLGLRQCFAENRRGLGFGPWILLLLAVLSGNNSHGQCTRGIETVAGKVALGDGGPATAAALNAPRGVTVDTAGNIYIADTDHHRIRKVSPTGLITTVAGDGTWGYRGDEGLAATARLAHPYDVTLDAAGNLYIADTANHCIRKVTPAGVITTVAGTPQIGGYSGDGGAATAARLNSPEAVAVDSAGNLYIADTGNHRIRKVTLTGIIATVAGTGIPGYSGDGGGATGAQLFCPSGVIVDAAGNLYIADSCNHRIRKVTTAGIISTVAGTGSLGYSGDGGPATAAALNSPRGLAVDWAGNLYIADTDNNRIRKVTPAGVITTVAGNGSWGYSGDAGPATAASLASPHDVAVDALGNLYIADTEDRRIRKVSQDGVITTTAGSGTATYSGDGGPATAATLNYPSGLATDSAGNLYIADTGNHRIRKVTPAGVITTVAGTGARSYSGDGGPATAAALNSPRGLAVDWAGNLYIADTDNNRIRKVTPAGVITTVAGNGSWGYSGDGGPATAAQLARPYGVAVDSAGNLYVADTQNHRIRQVTPSGVMTTVAGNGTSGYSGDGGPATAAALNSPSAVALDSAGNMYIADTENLRIRKVAPNGVISTLAGSGGIGHSGDGGPATQAQLSFPRGLAVDPASNLYFADNGSHVVRKITPGGVITTVAGNGLDGYSLEGVLATTTSLSYPDSVAIDALGNLYVSDTHNHLVRRVGLACQPEPVVVFRDSSSGISVLNGASGTRHSLGGLFAGDPGVGIDGGGRLVIAARDSYNSLWVNVADPRSGVSTGWRFAGGLIQGTPGVGAVSSATGSVAKVVVRDQWNSYWALSYDVTDAAVQGWEYLAGIFASDPAVAACADGTVYVVGKDQWGSLWSRHWIPGWGWEPWSWGMGVTQGKPSATCGRNQVVHVAVRDNWNTLWLTQVAGNRWLNWQWAGGVMTGDPEIASGSNGQIHVTLRDAWGGLWTRRYSEDTWQWSVWRFTNGLLSRQAPAVAGGALYVLGTDGAGQLWRYAAGLEQWTLLGHQNVVSGALAAAPK